MRALVKNSSGFSLVETLIAASVFSIGFMAITAVLSASGGNLRTAFFCDRAVFAGQDAAEILWAGDAGTLTPRGEPLEIRGQKVSWEAYGENDADNDGKPDFRTIELEVFRNKKQSSAGKQVLVKTFFRTGGY